MAVIAACGTHRGHVGEMHGEEGEVFGRSGALRMARHLRRGGWGWGAIDDAALTGATRMVACCSRQRRSICEE